jgi:hypothetical protein
MSAPRITLRGEAAIASGRPLWVLGLDGRWVPGTDATRERGRRMVARGYGHATWIYGAE